MRLNPRLAALAKQMRTAPCKIADIFGVNPIFVEKLLASRGFRCKDGESLQQLVARVYGEHVASEVLDLTREGPFIK